jgi:hypothetical protein
MSALECRIPGRRAAALLVSTLSQWLAIAPLGAAEPFKLVDDRGRSIDVEVESVNATEVKFARDGKPSGLLLARLDPGNREALLAMAKEKKIFNRYPPLDVQVTVRDSDRRQEDSSFMRHLWLTPTMTLEPGDRLLPVPELEATIQVICAETQALYVERRKLYQVRVRDKLAVPAAANGERRNFEFKTFELEFDEDRNRSNVGGWIYRYWICTLRDPASGMVVLVKTNYDALQKHLEQFPGERDRYIALGVGGEMPAKFEDPRTERNGETGPAPLPTGR